MALESHLEDSEHVPFYIYSEFVMGTDCIETPREQALSEYGCNCRKLPAQIIQVAALAMRNILAETFEKDVLDLFFRNCIRPVQIQLSRLNICSPPFTENSDKSDVGCIKGESRGEKCSTRIEDHIKEALCTDDRHLKDQIKLMEELLRNIICEAKWAQGIRGFEALQ